MALHPSQIVYLKHENVALYAEVIQMAIARPLCWVRPLALVEVPDGLQLSTLSSTQVEIYNLKEGSDLLWPASLFHPAIDVEVVPLLVSLEAEKRVQGADAIASIKLRHFIQSVWEANAALFEAVNSSPPTSHAN